MKIIDRQCFCGVCSKCPGACWLQPFPPIRDLSQRMSGFYSDTTLFPLFSSVSEHVIIERQSESTIMFVEGSKDSYLGYMTLKFSPGMSF